MQRGKEFWVNQLGISWAEVLKPVLKTEEMNRLINGLVFDYAFMHMYPEEKKDIFKAFRLCPFDNLRAVVIGTEPGLFTGTGPLAFSDSSASYTNPSVFKIRECVSKHKKDLGLEFDTTFEHWANQGILMLNRSLTCRQGETKTDKQDWKKFFGAVLYVITAYKPGTIFILWGKESQKYAELLSQDHYVFSWEHPMVAVNNYKSWDCPNFAQIDQLLEANETERIIW